MWERDGGSSTARRCLERAGSLNQKDRNAVADRIGKARFFTDQFMRFAVMNQRPTRFWADENAEHFRINRSGWHFYLGHFLSRREALLGRLGLRIPSAARRIQMHQPDKQATTLIRRFRF